MSDTLAWIVIILVVISLGVHDVLFIPAVATIVVTDILLKKLKEY